MREAESIPEVISMLDAIINKEIARNSNLAFFPILYKKVTERIQQGVIQQEFEDNPRMERLDVIFANRYLVAYDQFQTNQGTTVSWLNAFEAAKNSKHLILQHLLLGINAHINLDLGIAVSQTMEGNGNLEGIENDYLKINEILASMVDEVQQKLGAVSPLFYVLEKVAKGKEDAIASFSIEIARDEAWLFANEYHSVIDKVLCLKERDASIGRLAMKIIVTKSRVLSWALKIIRWLEKKNVADVARVLEG